MSDTQAICGLCGEPMPPNEQMFKYHGYSGPCPKPPLPRLSLADRIVQRVAELPDRHSPEDWPEAMLVTADELRGIVEEEKQK